ncbi:MAG: DMT family transporter [Aeromicrobium erythreum]
MSKPIGIHPAAVTGGLAVVLVLSWSTGFWGAALVPPGVRPSVLLLWRFVPVAVVLWAVVAARGLLPRREDLGHHVLVGLLAQVGYVVPVYVAVGLGVSTGTTSLVDAVQPVVVATLAGPLLGLAVRRLQWLGLLVSSVGVLLVVRADAVAGDAAPWAYAVPLVAVASLVAATVLERRRAERTPVPTMLAIHVSLTSAVLAVPALSGPDPVPADPAFWGVAALLAVGPTTLAYATYWCLLRRVDVTVLTALLLLVVPTTAVGGTLFLGEPFGPLTALGIGAVALGVGAVVRGERPVDRGVRSPATPPSPARTPARPAGR